MLALLILGLFVATLLVSFVLTREVRRVATARGWVTLPTERRHVHSNPIPQLGGVAIYLSFVLCSAVVLGLAVKFPELGMELSVHTLLTIFAAGTLVLLVGIYDDLRGASPALKFAVQGVAAVLLYLGGLRILNVPVLFGSHHPLAWFIGLPLTMLWVIGITNAFNLIDGLDGLAAGSALFSTLVVFVVALVSNAPLVALLSIALAGAILGFLKFNFNPATIFLGDSGALFIGFMLSALALQASQKASTVVAVAIPVVSFGLPILETALSVVRRWVSGRPVFTADREHIHHKLLELGYSHRQVVIVLYAVSAIFGLLSLFLLWPSGGTVGLVLTILGIGIWLGVQHLGYLEFGELRRVALRTMEQRQVVINNLALRRATAELAVATDHAQVCRILEAAFASNDFDGFSLIAASGSNCRQFFPSIASLEEAPDAFRFAWQRPGQKALLKQDVPQENSGWQIRLELSTPSGRLAGAMLVYRNYSDRPLLVDVNLLTAVFPAALATALDRTLDQELAGVHVG